MDIPEIDVTALRDRLTDGAPLIDVREPAEFEEARVPQAQLIPLGQITDRVDEVPADGVVYVICKSGGRSAKAVEFLRSQGRDAVNVTGGTLAWAGAGFPVDAGA